MFFAHLAGTQLLAKAMPQARNRKKLQKYKGRNRVGSKNGRKKATNFDIIAHFLAKRFLTLLLSVKPYARVGRCFPIFAATVKLFCNDQ